MRRPIQGGSNRDERMDKRCLYVTLNAITGITPRRFWQIVGQEALLEALWRGSQDAAAALGLTPEVLRRVRRVEPAQFLEAEEARVREVRGRIILHGEPDYPRGLMQIDDPPPVLYIIGELCKEDRLALAIVGSRAASTQGRLHAERISAKLAAGGLTIVSGLAMGIDTRAHRGALAGGGRTLAVLGCGLDYPYPRHNRELRSRIVQQGALISEFRMGTRPVPMNFPRRNRVISGLAMGTLVVEAAEKSGSLITARYALEQGRDVFAIPRNIDASNSSGVNALIQKGAKLVQGLNDIVEELPAAVQQYLAVKEEASVNGVPDGDTGAATLLELIDREPIHIDELTRKATITPAAISSLLMKLELQGLIRQLPGKHYTRQ